MLYLPTLIQKRDFIGLSFHEYLGIFVEYIIKFQSYESFKINEHTHVAHANPDWCFLMQ